MTLPHTRVGLGWLCLVLFAAAASGSVIYEHHFSGSAWISLNGLEPDTGGNAWIAHNDWRADGTPGNYSSATLQFTPEGGKVYRLSARLTGVTGNNDWLALGFTAGSSTSRYSNADRFIEGTTAGWPWMLRRGDQATLPDQTFTGPGTAGGADMPTLDRMANVDYAILLDTRQSQWTVEWLQKTTDQSEWQRVRTHTFANQPMIAAAGLARANTGTTGRIAYFCLEQVKTGAAFGPNGHPTDVAILEGHNAVFEAILTAQQRPTVRWYRQIDDIPIRIEPSPGEAAITLEDDSVQQQWRTSLILFNVQADDEGVYRCVIESEDGFTIQSDPARLTLKRLTAHWTLNASDYQQGSHLDRTEGLQLMTETPALFITGAAGTANTAIQVGHGGAGTSEPLAAVFENGLALSLWANLSEAGTLTVDEGQVELDGGLIEHDRWRHLCFVFDGQTMTLYIDGRLAGEQHWPLSATYEMVLKLGHAFGQRSFFGDLDDVRLYNYSLTPDEVYELYARRTGEGGCVLPYAYALDRSGPNGFPDCRIDLFDYAVLAGQWLSAQDPLASLNELAAFARHWLTDGLEMIP